LENLGDPTSAISSYLDALSGAIRSVCMNAWMEWSNNYREPSYNSTAAAAYACTQLRRHAINMVIRERNQWRGECSSSKAGRPIRPPVGYLVSSLPRSPPIECPSIHADSDARKPDPPPPSIISTTTHGEERFRLINCDDNIMAR
jgi:hypothetical protein